LLNYFSKSGTEISAACYTLSGEGLKKLILRSSAVDETLSDRGKYKSIILEDPTDLPATIRTAIEIYEGSVSTCASWRIPVVVEYAAARFRGMKRDAVPGMSIHGRQASV
jgi:hypothetical protein